MEVPTIVVNGPASTAIDRGGFGETAATWVRQHARGLTPFVRRPEMLVFAVLILVLNAPVLVGSCWQALIFQPGAVHDGEWWRLLTHPFVHLTWYHLLLDGSAFFILYYSLLESSWCRRLGYVVGGAMGSLVAAWAAGGSASGLCGLSGIAHGLMAVSAMEMLREHPSRSAEWRIGLVSLSLVVAKAGYEALSGRMVFSFLDFGLLGNPVSVSHAGGIIGALVLMLRFPSRRPAQVPGTGLRHLPAPEPGSSC